MQQCHNITNLILESNNEIKHRDNINYTCQHSMQTFGSQHAIFPLDWFYPTTLKNPTFWNRTYNSWWMKVRVMIKLSPFEVLLQENFILISLHNSHTCKIFPSRPYEFLLSTLHEIMKWLKKVKRDEDWGWDDKKSSEIRNLRLNMQDGDGFRTHFFSFPWFHVFSLIFSLNFDCEKS